MYAALALASAALYGAADFIGGLTSRRADTLAVVLVSQSAGLGLVAVVLVCGRAASPGQMDWVWGGMAGLTGGVGVALLYRALAVGVMAVVAPVTAVCAVAVPVITALGFGERPGPQATAGIVTAMAAIVLISRQEASGGAFPSSRPRRSGLNLAFASGIAIGVFFLALARTSPESGLSPLLAARVVSVLLFGTLLAVSRRPWHMPPPVTAIAIAGGVLDMLANVLYLLASRAGPLTFVITLSSLYPASTVMLARSVLHERLTGRQWVGVACALAAIVMIVAA